MTAPATAARHRSSLLALVPPRLRRPEQLVARTQWLFAVLAMLSLLFTVPAALSFSSGRVLLLALVSAAVLIASWTLGYIRRRGSIGMDIVDSLAMIAFALACPDPLVILSFMFPALWFRSLYGSTLRATLRCCMYAAAIVATAQLWSLVPERPEVVEPFGALPTLFLTLVVARHLAGMVRAREQAALREAVHASAGSLLLSITDAAEIRRVAWVAITRICDITPGLRVLKVVREGEGLRVQVAAGGFAGMPATLPESVLLVRGGGAPTAGHGRADRADGIPPSTAELDAAAGAACDWVCISLPIVQLEFGAGWLIIGCPGRVPAEALTSLGSLVNQVTLALRNSEVHQELTAQATIDNLTGLANRSAFYAAISAALIDQSAEHTTVLFIDLDDFKDVNDVFGHGAGDQLLREIAARLRRATRPDDICARLGGDEFAVLLHRTNGAVAAEIAQRIVSAVAAPARVGPTHLGLGVAHVGASVGVATATSATNLEDLIHRADVAMYAAKANGKGRLQIFEAGLLTVDTAQQLFERELAAATGNGELVVHYQPIVAVDDGSCSAVEALVRWQHPQRGLLYPQSFVEAAERTGVIAEIGSFVLHQACADAATWRDACPQAPLALHVNVSALQLEDDAFVADVEQCLAEFRLRHEQLVLEITETLVISSPASVDRLNTLAARGVSIAIDDFGTGYAALTTLRSLPIQIVKIDRSVVAGSTHNAEDRVVTEAIVKMTSQMGMRTIAEGVERLDQHNLLAAIGAHAAQGYLYLRPSTATDFAAWLQSHRVESSAESSRNAGPRDFADLADAGPDPYNNVVVAFAPRQAGTNVG